MKALLVVDNDNAISNISEVLKAAGYDVIVYKWLLKALDNIEEIAPHLLVISTKDYPRHWKTLVQYAKNIVADYTPQVILYASEDLDDDELHKAEALGVRGIFNSIEVEGLDKLREILIKKDDIYSGYLTEPEQGEISLSDIIPGLEDLSKEINSLSEVLKEPIKVEKEEETENSEEMTESSDEMAEASEEVAENSDEMTENSEEVAENSVEAEAEVPENDETVEDVEETQDKVESEPEVSDNIDNVQEEIIEESAESDIITEESDTTEDETMDEMSIEEKLAAIMNANKADAKEKAEEVGIESTSCSFVFTNPVTLAMVSGTARNYNGMTLEFTPDIPSFIMNLDSGTQINVASLKVNGEITNVRSEVMSNDSTKLYLQIKK